MKEELRAGKSVETALDTVKRAWNSIRDSNLSTLITCLILYNFGLNYQGLRSYIGAWVSDLYDHGDFGVTDVYVFVCA
ncbi:MAG: hypothetical protein U0526_03585 [Candidatus Saccharibacteria bacterium]